MIDSQYKISIIVPVYNVEKYLVRCIDSILKQTYRNLEIILVDDGSTDKSGEICDYYAQKDIRIIVVHKQNRGLSSARNAGLELATGDFIGFVDSDDWISVDMYEYLLNILLENNCDISCVNFICVRKPIQFFQTNIKLEILTKDEILIGYLYRGAIGPDEYSVCRYLYNKSVFNKQKFPIGKICEDIVTNYNFLRQSNKLIKSSKVSYFYYQGSESISRSGLRHIDRDLLEAYEELYQLALKLNNDRALYYAKLIKARSSFSILAKIAYYGIVDNDIDKKEIIKEYTSKLRHDLCFLLRSPILFNRKVLMLSASVNFKLFKSIVEIYKLQKTLLHS